MIQKLPHAREEQLIVRELAGELLIYDLAHHRGHSLHPVAALVWRHCDGRTTVAELAALLHRQLGIPPDETTVWLALERLDKAGLLYGRVPTPREAQLTCRRTLVRRLAVAGGLALVTSIVAPEEAMAASVVSPSACAARDHNHCGGTPCIGGGHCTKNGSVCACL